MMNTQYLGYMHKHNSNIKVTVGMTDNKYENKFLFSRKKLSKKQAAINDTWITCTRALPLFEI